MKKISLILSFLFSSLLALAQDVDMADTFRKEGKIYVVIAVAGIVLIGIFVYLFMLDKRLKNLENKKK